MKELRGLRACADYLRQTLWLDGETLYHHMLSCQTRYRPSRNPRLRAQLVPQEGALSHVEGLVLYALVRASRAQNVIELGTYAGHSTNYLAEALWHNGGYVDTVDLVRYWGGVFRGQAITLRNRLCVRQHKSDALEYLMLRENSSVDFIFEDTSHTYRDTCELICEAQLVLKPGGLLAIHDVAVEHVRVKEAVEDSGLSFISFKVWPGEHGIALWRKP